MTDEKTLEQKLNDRVRAAASTAKVEDTDFYRGMFLQERAIRINSQIETLQRDLRDAETARNAYSKGISEKYGESGKYTILSDVQADGSIVRILTDTLNQIRDDVSEDAPKAPADPPPDTQEVTPSSTPEVV